MDFLECSLLKVKKITPKALGLVLRSSMSFKALQMSRIINALDVSNFDDFMIEFHTHGANSVDKKELQHIAEQMEESHLVSGLYGPGIIVSNKGCKINGHIAKYR